MNPVGVSRYSDAFFKFFYYALCFTPGVRLPVLGPHGGAFVPTLDVNPPKRTQRLAI